MTDLASSPYFLVVLVISALALPLIYLIMIRNTARYGREPWRTVLWTFAWGAIISVLIAVLLSTLLLATFNRVQSLNDFFARRFADPGFAIAVLIVAPLGEEAAKGVGARAGRRQTQSKIDGLVYGAAADSDSQPPRISSTASQPCSTPPWVHRAPSFSSRFGHSPRLFSTRAHQQSSDTAWRRSG
jgi:hypothetical protein